MTAKEKAKELVYKFSTVGLQQRNEGKSCALIAVDEILSQIDNWGIVSVKGYWLNVKNQIELL